MSGGNGSGGGASSGSTVSGTTSGDRGRGKGDLRAMQRGGQGLSGRRTLEETDDDQEEIDLSTGSHTRRELLPPGGGRYAQMGLPHSQNDPKNPTKVAGSQGPSAPVSTAPTSASWSTHLGSVFSGLSQQVQATTSSGPSSSSSSSSSSSGNRFRTPHFSLLILGSVNTITTSHTDPWHNPSNDPWSTNFSLLPSFSH